MSTSRTVALVTLGCARNEVDSEELAGRLEAQGWTLVDDAADADVAVVNTCGFVEQAKKDSIDTLLEASALKETRTHPRGRGAVGCLAERYGEQLAAELPEADAVLGFDSYADLSAHLDAILHGGRPASHVPRRPAHPAAAQPGRPPGVGRRAARPRRRAQPRAAGPARPARRAGPGQWAAGRAPPAGRPPLGPAEDRVRLRPALRLLRHPVVPRARSCRGARPTSWPKRAGWAARACASCSW